MPEADVDRLFTRGSVPIDSIPAPPPQATMRVEACVGCGKLPHGSINERIACLEREIGRLRNKLGSERWK